jgi:two-component system, sensor histidine kinase and response regulator
MFFLSSKDQVGDLDQLQKRMTEVFVFLSGVLLILLSFSDFFIGLDPFIIWVKVILAIPFLLGFVLMRKIGFHQPALNILYGLGLLVIILNYFYNDGYRGPTIYTVYIFVVANVILMKKWIRVVWLLITLTIYSLLFWGEISGKFFIESHYNGPWNLFEDHLITILWTSLFSFFGIYIFIQNYRIQNALMAKLQAEKDVANKELEELNSKKNQLIALLSHDLRSPIGVLNSTLELVDRQVLDKEDLETLLKELKDQSFHLNKILNNTLTWVMSELDEKEILKEQVSVFALTKEIAETMQVQAQRKEQEILVVFEGEDLVTDIESQEVKIILKNFLDNAIKFSPSRTKIDLSLKVNGKGIRWEVRNEGEEITEEIIKDLFEFKVRRSVGTSHEKGTGIGLPLCKRIAEKLGFSIGVDLNRKDSIVFYLESKIQKKKERIKSELLLGSLPHEPQSPTTVRYQQFWKARR